MVIIRAQKINSYLFLPESLCSLLEERRIHVKHLHLNVIEKYNRSHYKVQTPRWKSQLIPSLFICVIPHFPCSKLFQTLSFPTPSGVTRPILDKPDLVKFISMFTLQLNPLLMDTLEFGPCLSWRWGGTPYNGLYGEASAERGTYFRHQEYERVRILLIEVYKMVGKSVIWVCERAQRTEQMNFMAL